MISIVLSFDLKVEQKTDKYGIMLQFNGRFEMASEKTDTIVISLSKNDR